MKLVDENSNQPASLSAVARKLHPEDIEINDNVAVSETLCQYPSYLWQCVDTTRLPPEQPVRLTYLPYSCEIYSVKAVCLPFVLCRSQDKKHKVFDIRQDQLSRVTQDFADKVRAAIKEDESALKSKQSKKNLKAKSKKKKKRKK